MALAHSFQSRRAPRFRAPGAAPWAVCLLLGFGLAEGLGCSKSEPGNEGACGEGAPGPTVAPVGGKPSYELCRTACSRAVEAGCSQASAADCAVACARHADEVAGCQDRAVDLLRCQQIGTITCDPLGKPVFGGCDDSQAKYAACLQQPPGSGGTGGGAGAAGGPDAGGGDLPNVCGIDQANDCDACWATTCCDQERACADDYECDALRNSLRACNGLACCAQRARETYAGGGAKYDALENCLGAHCPCGP